MAAREKIAGFNFIKAICPLGIAVFHFSEAAFGVQLLPGNIPFPSYISTCFFIVSGALLYYNYGVPQNTRLFFYKRWKSIFIPFYLAFLCVYALRAIKNSSLFYAGKPARLLLSLIGMDGYLSGKLDTYYILGEWFLGAVIIMYLLYPLLVRLVTKNEAAAASLVLILYIASLFISKWSINDFKSVFSCCLSFFIGIIIEKHRLYKYKAAIIPAVIIFIALCFSGSFIQSNLAAHIGGICLFFILFALGEFITYFKAADRAVSFLGSITFDIYLIHHVLIYYALEILAPFESMALNLVYLAALLAVIVLVSFLFSKAVHLIIYDRKWYKSLEKKLFYK